MAKRYTLNHMFAHKFGDDAEATVLTRDNESLLATLPDKVLKDAVAKGFVQETEISSAFAAQLKAQSTDTPLAEFNARRDEASNAGSGKRRRPRSTEE